MTATSFAMPHTSLYLASGCFGKPVRHVHRKICSRSTILPWCHSQFGGIVILSSGADWCVKYWAFLSLFLKVHELHCYDYNPWRDVILEGSLCQRRVYGRSRMSPSSLTLMLWWAGNPRSTTNPLSHCAAWMMSLEDTVKCIIPGWELS